MAYSFFGFFLLPSIFISALACDETGHAKLGWMFTRDYQNGATTTPIYGNLDAQVRMNVVRKNAAGTILLLVPPISSSIETTL